MSSIDQAFVKAFARRNRPAASNAAGTSLDEGSLTVDRSVAETARIWVDPVEDQLVRADHPDSTAPKPHLEPAAAHETPPAAAAAAAAAPTAAAPTAAAADGSANLHTAYAIAALTTDAMQSPAKISPWASIVVESAVTSEAIKTVVSPPATESPEAQRPLVEMRIDAPATSISANAPSDPVTGQPTAGQATEMTGEAPISSGIFQAAWEVDVFDVPNKVADLFFEGHLFQQIADRILDAVNTGLSRVLITSAHTAEGRSTVAIGIAMAAAAAGIRVALVDADTENPTLMENLGLELQCGWVDTIRGGLPIQEAAVHAVEDGVTLIPLLPPHGHTAATAYEVAQLLNLLKHKFEVVIIDGPAETSTAIRQCASATESAIIVRDITRTSPDEVLKFSVRLREAGVQGVGIVENFV